jgi:uncharacterized protein YraI
MNFILRIALAAALILSATYSAQVTHSTATPNMLSGNPEPQCPPQGCSGGVGY